MTTENDILAARVAALENQLAALQAFIGGQSTMANTLCIPVRVVDRAGNLLAEFTQAEHDLSLRFFNRLGEMVAAIGVEGTQSGYVALRNADGKLLACLDIELAGARLQLLDHKNNGGLILFGGSSDELGGGINVISATGNLSASLWSGEQNGEMTLYDVQAEAEAVRLPTQKQKQ